MKETTFNSVFTVKFYKRKLFQGAFEEYLGDYSLLVQSLSPMNNLDQVFKAGQGAGRSGSFFFFSADKKFIIKTMTKSEKSLFLSMAEEYTNYFVGHQDSLIAKIFGVFKVKIANMGKVYLMLSENVIPFQDEENIDFIFDLKGSLVDRKVKGNIKRDTILKDINFLIACKPNPDLVKLEEDDRE